MVTPPALLTRIMHCAICSVQWAMQMQHPVCGVQCAACNEQCVVCSVQYAVCSVQHVSVSRLCHQAADNLAADFLNKFTIEEADVLKVFFVLCSGPKRESPVFFCFRAPNGKVAKQKKKKEKKKDFGKNKRFVGYVC